MKTKQFHKTKVYSRMFIPLEHKQKAVGHDGWSDGKYEYFSREERTKDVFGKETIWYAIDPMSGLAFGEGKSRKECADIVHSEKMQELFAEKQKTREYHKAVSDWYNLMVECGAYMENPIK